MTLYLPRSGGASIASAPMPALALAVATARAPEERKVVVVVEDEPLIRELMVDGLTELGYRVLEAHDGPSALLVLASAVPVDLLLTDVHLRGMSGPQLAEAACIHRPGLKVLFMTGSTETIAIDPDFLKPDRAVLIKPFRMERLDLHIRHMIDSRQGAYEAQECSP